MLFFRFPLLNIATVHQPRNAKHHLDAFVNENFSLIMYNINANVTIIFVREYNVFNVGIKETLKGLRYVSNTTNMIKFLTLTITIFPSRDFVSSQDSTPIVQ